MYEIPEFEIRLVLKWSPSGPLTAVEHNDAHSRWAVGSFTSDKELEVYELSAHRPRELLTLPVRFLHVLMT